MPTRARLAAAAFAALSLGDTAFAIGFWPADAGWMIAFLGVAALFAGVATLLARGVTWAPAVAIGLAGFTSGFWIQSLIALGPAATWNGSAQTSMCTCGVGLLISLAALLAAWSVPRRAALRHTLATVFAGGALLPSVLFALAPSQSLSSAISMGIGAASVLAGTIAVGRGRTWGLLAELAGAIVMAFGVASAPVLAALSAAHPWLPNSGGFLVVLLGLCATVLAALPFALYAKQAVAFLRRA